MKEYSRALIALLCVVVAGCGNAQEPFNDSDASTDSDTDGDSDTDSDSDTDGDSDTDSDADTDSDTDSDTDTDISGECTDNSDCPGGACELVPDEPGGWWTCIYPPDSPTTVPSPNPGSDGCTTSEDCPGVDCDCYLVQELYVGFVHPHNECFCDECDDDSDCSSPAEQQCIPAGAWGFQKDTCVYVGCKVNSDCTYSTGGVCMPYFDSICSSLDPPPLISKGCHYDGDPCVEPGDCPTSWDMCAPSVGETGFTCQSWACPG